MVPEECRSCDCEALAGVAGATAPLQCNGGDGSRDLCRVCRTRPLLFPLLASSSEERRLSSVSRATATISLSGAGEGTAFTSKASCCGVCGSGCGGSLSFLVELEGVNGRNDGERASMCALSRCAPPSAISHTQSQVSRGGTCQRWLQPLRNFQAQLPKSPVLLNEVKSKDGNTPIVTGSDWLSGCAAEVVLASCLAEGKAAGCTPSRCTMSRCVEPAAGSEATPPDIAAMYIASLSWPAVGSCRNAAGDAREGGCRVGAVEDSRRPASGRVGVAL